MHFLQEKSRYFFECSTYTVLNSKLNTSVHEYIFSYRIVESTEYVYTCVHTNSSKGDEQEVE